MTRLRRKVALLLVLIVGGLYGAVGLLSNVKAVSNPRSGIKIELAGEETFPDPDAPVFGIGGSGGGI